MKKNRVKQLRLAEKLTQQQIADHCNIALRTYQRIERGERNGDIIVWIQLAKYYGVTIDYLLEQGADDEPNHTK